MWPGWGREALLAIRVGEGRLHCVRSGLLHFSPGPTTRIGALLKISSLVNIPWLTIHKYDSPQLAARMLHFFSSWDYSMFLTNHILPGLTLIHNIFCIAGIYSPPSLMTQS